MASLYTEEADRNLDALIALAAPFVIDNCKAAPLSD